ncbi:MAG TPA: hypothetical protein VIV01_22025 [Hyphomicrobiaceae bacterium]
MEIAPPGWDIPDTVLQIGGLPPGATLTDGRPLSSGMWTVPIAALSNLEINAPAGVSEPSNLTLALVRADGTILAEARTVLSILEPIGAKTAVRERQPEQSKEKDGPRVATAGIATASSETSKAEPTRTEARPTIGAEEERAEAARKAAEAKKAEEERKAADAAKKAEEARRLAEAKMAEEERRAEAARKAAEAKKAEEYRRLDEAKGRLAQVAGEEAERGLTRPSPGSLRPPAIKPEPKLAAIHDRPTAATEAAPLPADRERLAKMIARGERELEAGNVSAARQFFLRAADGGLARAALLLAWTYDKDEFARLRILGVMPNRELADKWYKRAHELEAPDKTGAR